MRLQQLQLIVTLAETGSLRSAAQALNVTQPALTKALRQLEDELGAPLVLRTPKGVQLTPSGELVRARASSALREVERAREDVAWQMRHTAARVAVGLSPAAALLLMPGALARLRVRWPQVRAALVDALYPRSLTMVRAGEIDLSVGPLPKDSGERDLHLQALFDGETTLVVRKGSPLRKARQLADLRAAPWVLTGPVGGPGDPRRLTVDGGPLPDSAIALECESFATLLAVLPSMDAVALVPSGFFAIHGPGAGLQALPVSDPLPHVTLYAAWRASTPLTAPAAYLLDALVQEARSVRQGPRSGPAGRRRSPTP